MKEGNHSLPDGRLVAVGSPPTVVETRLLSNNRAKSGLDLYEQLVVYQEAPLVNGRPTPPFQVYALSIGSGAPFAVSPGSQADQKMPRVHGSRIVWADWRDGASPSLYGYQEGAGTPVARVVGAASSMVPSALRGELVAYQDGREEPKRVHLRSLTTGQDLLLDPGAEVQIEEFPLLADGLVAFQQRGVDGLDHVRVFAITQSGSQLSVQPLFNTASLSSTSSQTNPQLYGDPQNWTLVWMDDRSAAPGLYGYRSVGLEFPVSLVKSNKSNLSLHGDIVAWQDYRSAGKWHIYGYSISRALEFPICTVSGNQTEPRVFGDRVVWVDSRNGGYDLYGAVLQWGDGTATPTSTTTLTPTATMTPTAIASATATASATTAPTGTGTATLTPNPTATSRQTTTATPTGTATPNQTVTSTAATIVETVTVTATPTKTGTPTSTATFTATPTEMAMPTETGTPTTTPTATPTPTKTGTPIPTPTTTATMTATATAAATATGTLTSTTTPTATTTPTDTATATAIETATPSATATAIPTTTSTPTFTPTGTSTPTPTVTASPTPTPTPTATPSPTYAPVFIRLLRPPLEVTVGDVFYVDVEIDAAAQDFNGFQAYVSWQPEILELIPGQLSPLMWVVPRSSLPVVIPGTNVADNNTGRAAFAAGIFGDTVRGTLLVASLKYRALRSGDCPITFQFDPAAADDTPPRPMRYTRVTYLDGTDLLGGPSHSTPLTIRVSAPTVAPTASPTVTRTPAATATITPTGTAATAVTATPSRTPTPTRTPTATRTPSPTRTPTSTRTAAPEPADAPEPEPRETPEPEPTSTPEPAAMVIPTIAVTANIAPTLFPTPTDYPTPTPESGLILFVRPDSTPLPSPPEEIGGVAVPTLGPTLPVLLPSDPPAGITPVEGDGVIAIIPPTPGVGVVTVDGDGTALELRVDSQGLSTAVRFQPLEALPPGTTLPPGVEVARLFTLDLYRYDAATNSAVRRSDDEKGRSSPIVLRWLVTEEEYEGTRDESGDARTDRLALLRLAPDGRIVRIPSQWSPEPAPYGCITALFIDRSTYLLTTLPPAVEGNSAPRDPQYFPETGFRINHPGFWEYFQRRGGVWSFGLPISREFVLRGYIVQLFQRALLQQLPDGSVVLMNLLDEGLMPYGRANFSVFPLAEEQLIRGAPSPSEADYGERAIAFLQENVPDRWEGLEVGFLRGYLSTVRRDDAFPEGDGDPALLPLLNLELWGLPTSLPVRDPNNHDFVYQRFQRGILHYDASTGATQGLLLGDYLKSIMTRIGLPWDLAREARDSSLYRQYDRTSPGHLARPDELPYTNLVGAFEMDVPQEILGAD
jgi:beta propeller repeat protein